MGSALSAIKTIFAPALISLIIFLLVTFVFFPFWRRYRNTYSQYLPLDTISDRTASWRHRISARLFAMLMPSAWRREEAVDMDTGEELNDVDGDALSEMERRLGQSPLPDHTPRLSRDLEQGFMDDSDEDEDDYSGRR